MSPRVYGCMLLLECLYICLCNSILGRYCVSVQSTPSTIYYFFSLSCATIIDTVSMHTSTCQGLCNRMKQISAYFSSYCKWSCDDSSILLRSILFVLDWPIAYTSTVYKYNIQYIASGRQQLVSDYVCSSWITNNNNTCANHPSTGQPINSCPTRRVSDPWYSSFCRIVAS